jgi:hypothetical protein
MDLISVGLREIIENKLDAMKVCDRVSEVEGRRKRKETNEGKKV